MTFFFLFFFCWRLFELHQSSQLIRAKLHKSRTWHERMRQDNTRLSRQPIKKKKSHSILAIVHCPKPKAQCTNLKVEMWQTKPQRVPKLPQFNSSTLSLVVLCLCPSSHIPHFFSFTQSSQSLRLYLSPVLYFLTSLIFCL